MNKTTLFLLLLTMVTLCTTTNYTYQNQTTFQNIISFYNAQQFTNIYQLMTPQWFTGDESQQIMDDKDSQYDEAMQLYTQTLSSLYKSNGPIAYKIIPNNFTNHQPQQYTDQAYNSYDGMVVYNNSLQIQSLNVVVDEGEISDIVFTTDYPASRSILPSQNEQSYNISLAILLNGVDSIGVNMKFRMAGQQCHVPIMIIALEFARQVDAKIIDPTTMIDREYITKYHIPYYDTTLFELLYSPHKNKQINSVSLQNIAIGMVLYQSPGLAEYLQSYLGIWNIDRMRKQIGMKQRNPYYLASFMVAFSNYMNLTALDYATSMSGMTSKLLYQSQLSIHHTLRARNTTSWKTLKQTNAYLQKRKVLVAVNKWSVKYTSLEQATLYNNINNSSMISTQIANLFYEILQPKQDKLYIWIPRQFYVLMGTNKLSKAINGISQISYALFIDGKLYYFDEIIPTLHQLILNDPLFCQDLVLRLNNEKAQKKH